MQDFERWWRKQDRRYGLQWRAANVLVLAVVLAGIIIPVAQEIVHNNSYRLSADALKLIGSTDPTLSKQLAYNAQTQTYEFNKGAIKPTNSSPADLQAQVGTASGKGNDKSLYALDVPENFGQGVTYHDINTSLSFSLVPEFTAFSGRSEQGHLVFPLSGDTQAIYTLKNNGLKEDIVLNTVSSNTMTFSYRLDLPKTLEAKVIPDSGGAIGIYSADPTLFSNITYGSSSDRAAVEKARESGAKTNLVFGLPSPVVKDTAGNQVGNARFMLSGNTLKVVASGLREAHGPVTIDPSVVVTSTSDFQNGNPEDNIDFGTSGQITRGLGGGELGAWHTEPTLVTKREFNASAAYNGFIYTAGGRSGVNTIETTVEYAPVNADGTLGTWTKSANTYTNAGVGISLVAYDGYLYVTGGAQNGTFYQNVQYAKINADGSIGTWRSATSLPGPLSGQSMVAYNGNLYVIGGCTATAGAFGGWLCNTFTTSIIMAPVNADGSLGAWANANSGTSFTTARQNFGAVADNNRLYIMGGCISTNTNSACATTGNDIQYATISSTTGQLSGWTTATNSFATTRSDFGVGVSGGYLYIMGGGPGSGLNYYSDVQYAPIYANGNLGTWATTTPMTTGLTTDGAVVYKNRAYVVGGCSNTSTNCNSYIGVTNAASSSPIGPAGTTSSWTATTAYPSTTTGPGQTTNAGCVTYNGYIYMVGGYTNKDSAYSNYVEYAPVGSSGIGTWNATSSLVYGVGAVAVTAYNGYIYAVGGFDAVTANPTSWVQYAKINADGTLGAWATTTAYSSSAGYTTAGHSAVAYNGYLYARGYNSGYSQFVFYAPINSDGTIGTWVQATSLNTQRAFDQMVQIGNHLYDIGGTDPTSKTVATTEYATINSNGSLGAWTAGTSMISPRDKFSAVVYNGYIYAVGGEDNNSGLDLSSVEAAPITSTGSIGTWASTTALPATMKNGAVAVANNYLYSVSGIVAGSRSLNDYYAFINNGGNGAAGTWASTSSFITARYNHSAVAYNGYLYIAGGVETPGNDIQYTPINSDGTLGAWHYTHNSTDDGTTFVAGFNGPRDSFGFVAYQGYLYIVGGGDCGIEAPCNDVQYAPVNANGTVGTWQTSSNTLPDYKMYGATVVSNGYLYTMGGKDDDEAPASVLKTVYYAKINSDGSVGTWGTTTSLPAATRNMPAIAYNGYIYMLGGDSNSTATKNVYYARVNSTDGTLGSWSRATNLPSATTEMTAVAVNGYMYVMGGVPNGNSTLNPMNSVLYAPIHADGTLGAWNTAPGFTTARSRHAAAVYNGYVYILGGYTSSGVASDVQYAPVNSIARTAHYSKLLDFGAATNITGVTYHGSGTGTVSISYEGAGSGAVFGSSASISNIAGAGGCYGNLQNTRYLFVSITLDDSYGQGTGGVFPDASGTNANLTDLTVNYYARHPAPNIRLRLGQTLQQGTLSPFDTCFP